MNDRLSRLPGSDIISEGIEHLARGRETIAALRGLLDDHRPVDPAARVELPADHRGDLGLII